jgi:hypothetical protein
MRGWTIGKSDQRSMGFLPLTKSFALPEIDNPNRYSPDLGGEYVALALTNSIFGRLNGMLSLKGIEDFRDTVE